MAHFYMLTGKTLRIQTDKMPRILCHLFGIIFYLYLPLQFLSVSNDNFIVLLSFLSTAEVRDEEEEFVYRSPGTKSRPRKPVSTQIDLDSEGSEVCKLLMWIRAQNYNASLKLSKTYVKYQYFNMLY